MIPRVNLLTFDSPIQSPQGIVYSTSPRRAEAEGGSYFIKGPEVEVVFAEIAGCALAREVGLPVPDVAACEGEGETYAGSLRVKDALRDIAPLITQLDGVTNPEDLFNAIVVDVWLANTDRNLGNVVGRPLGGGRVELVFIDFEKSVALRPQPYVSSTAVEARKLWPTVELGNELRQRKPLHPPTEIIDRIHSLPTERCAELIGEAVAAIGSPVPWADDSAFALSKRAVKIQQLVEEVWATA